jgi:lactoylglutathione lyase
MKVAHSCYRVSDLDRSLAFYGALGFTEAVRLPLHTGTGWAVFLQLDGDTEPRIELWHEPATGLHAPGGGYGHVGVAVEDLDGTLTRLAMHGIKPLVEPFKPVPDGPTRLTFVADPDGYQVELLENYPY